MKTLRARLAVAGVKRSFLDKVVLPPWWEESIAASPGGMREAAGYICAHLGYSLSSLLDEKLPLTFAQQAGVKYKKAKGVTQEDVSLATHYSLGVARAIATAFTESAPSTSFPAPEQWRQTLLASAAGGWVGLPEIIHASWESGVPVVHIRNLPAGAKRPDALTTMIGDRPVIVVLNARRSPSWIAFIVAHELGHIHRGHLKPGQTVVDEKIDTQAEDKDEADANDYASKLLTGHSNLGLHSSRSLNMHQLATAVQSFGQDYKIAPGVAALNYGFTTNSWAAAMGAVSILEKGEDAAEHLKRAMERHLKSDTVTEDAWDWIQRATAVE